MFIKFGISLIVFKFFVISSPSLPSPLDRPCINLPFRKVNEAEIPSILGSALYSILSVSFRLRKLKIFFSKLFKSSSLKALPNESIGILCLIFLKFFEGLNPTVVLGESLFFKNLYFISKSRTSFFKKSYSWSVTIGLFLS